MLKKIILPVVLLIFTQQELYGANVKKKEKEKDFEQFDTITKEDSTDWTPINNWVNIDWSVGSLRVCPKLKWVWVIFDNVQFQYGCSKIWKHGKAYYGLSNGIGFFPSALNFGWLKIGIVDAHINVINTILVGLKFFVAKKSSKKEYSLWENILYTLYYNSVITGIHLLSFNFINCIKIKIISIGMIIGVFTGLIKNKDKDNAWYHTCFYGCKNITDTCDDMSIAYLKLSPRIEINIPEIINYFNGK